MGYMILSIRYRRKSGRNESRVRELERTIDKLKSRNGKLWYDMLQRRNRGSTEGEPNELTVTRELAVDRG
jgi:hypothetical protein